MPSWRTVVAALLNARSTSRRFCRSTASSTNVAIFNKSSGGSNCDVDGEFPLVITGNCVVGLRSASSTLCKGAAILKSQCRRKRASGLLWMCRWANVGRAVIKEAVGNYSIVFLTALVYESLPIDCHVSCDYAKKGYEAIRPRCRYICKFASPLFYSLAFLTKRV
jgi:hypothetical protein